MDKITFNWENEEIKYNGLVFTFRKVKKFFNDHYAGVVADYRIKPNFDKETGEIWYNTDWFGLFYDQRNDRLRLILNYLIKYEG